MQKYSVTRRISIDAAHRVSTHGSKCRNLHGHRYMIEATCVARAGLLHEDGEQTDMVADGLVHNLGRSLGHLFPPLVQLSTETPADALNELTPPFPFLGRPHFSKGPLLRQRLGVQAVSGGASLRFWQEERRRGVSPA